MSFHGSGKTKLVCRIAFVERTDTENLRHCAFIGLRDDKKPAAVVRELEPGGYLEATIPAKFRELKDTLWQWQGGNSCSLHSEPPRKSP